LAKKVDDDEVLEIIDLYEIIELNNSMNDLGKLSEKIVGKKVILKVFDENYRGSLIGCKKIGDNYIKLVMDKIMCPLLLKMEGLGLIFM